MPKRKSGAKCLLISTPKGMDSLQPVLKETIAKKKFDIQLELYTQSDRNLIIHSGRQREKDFSSTIKSIDLILVDLERVHPYTFFEIGIAHAIGKPIVFIAESFFLEDLPDFLRQSYFIIYNKEKGELQKKFDEFLTEFLENPKRFAPRRIVESDTSNQIVVDLEKLNQRDFENLCFELLSRLGYKQLEWKIKDEFIDAVTTLKKQDPDGFEYDEFWLISFRKEFVNDRLFEMAILEPEYLVERVYRNILESDMIGRNRIMLERGDVPITLLFILRGKEGYPKKLIKEISRRDFRMTRRGLPLTIRIRWWDEQNITALVQNNLTLARKYFSSEALARSGTRLSYEELYKQYADMNSELQTTNQQLVSERNRIELLERDAAWKLLSFTAAHRLGNPMDAIDSELSNLKLALKLGKTDVINDIVNSMETPVERAKSIVSEFRNLSIAQEIKPENINSDKLNEILKSAIKQAADKNIKVELNLKKVPDLAIDTQKISDCFTELVSNSLHFVTQEHQYISVSVELSKKSQLPDKIDRTKDYVKITFWDNGCGIPLEKKKEIFKPFEKGYVHGTGLGLAFCESVIERHGGKIREIGKPNENAIFEVFLPIVEIKKQKD